MKRKIAFGVIFFLWAIKANPDPQLIPLTFENNKKIFAEVARTERDRNHGLMYRENLGDNQGMLFVFDQPVNSSFWMKNCKIYLDIIWLNENKKILNIQENAPPCYYEPCPTYSANQKALYVIEIPGGTAKKHGIKPGMKVDFSAEN